MAIEEVPIPPLGSVLTEVESLAGSLRQRDPNLYLALHLLNKQISEVSNIISPLIIALPRLISGGGTVVAPIGFIALSTGKVIRLTWNSSVNAAQYELRIGTSWDTASFRLEVKAGELRFTGRSR